MAQTDKAADDWMPLYFSAIAGASTCIGAGIVFLLPSTNSSSENSKSVRIVPPGLMSFSLSLAGSVMVTVSVISILPECLVDDHGGDWITWDNLIFRILFFASGWGLYLGLNKCLSIPDPEDLLASAVLPLTSPKKNTNPNHGEKTKEDHDYSGEDDEDEVLPFLSSPNNNENNSRENHNDSSITPISKKSDDHVRSRRASNLSPTTKRSEVNGGNYMWMMNSITSSSGTTISEWTSGKDLQTKEQRNAWRVAILLFFSLLFHNFPEGLAVAASTLESEKLGITVMIGIMIHNIPEGIAIAIPCLAARPDQPWLSFFMASISGLAEPLGAFFALMFLRLGAPISSSSMVWNIENILAFVAGIMIAVAVCELFPEAIRQTKQNDWKYFWIGTVSGVIVMVVTEWYT
eukprot:CAMPEP_0197823534 /NCGR_PEP_ID=MMETSP1437-20131217/874_1 /TAXON_ID=49252 ORGANISM="Eucampia antarctica, Strain CCMP1452" /NCGR_SAMPLE_ID=MMETSP1437 /ASSEMBLY_ACC=CAM_ASM_001096 /LENGTH=404 /DNA_ID=CAMNT_0043422755 /DNA_START=47 /DNA_END=1261 /DNA_ORIENTATION=+